MDRSLAKSIGLVIAMFTLFVGLHFTQRANADSVGGPWSDSCAAQTAPCYNNATSALQVCNGGCNGNQSCLNNCQTVYNSSVAACNTQKNSCISGRQQTRNGLCNSYCGAPPQGGARYTDPSFSCDCTCCVGGPPLSGCVCVASYWQCYSPILIDLGGRGFKLTDANHGVRFNLTGKGAEQYSWTAEGANNGWLVLDRNGNGIIDDGSEMFGNMTPQPASSLPNGYLALGVYDQAQEGGNGDGYIDQRDAIYSKLRVWVDRNHDGFSQPEELLTLKDAGVHRIDLHYQYVPQVDQFNNVFALRARIFDARSKQDGKWAWDVYLQKLN